MSGEFDEIFEELQEILAQPNSDLTGHSTSEEMPQPDSQVATETKVYLFPVSQKVKVLRHRRASISELSVGGLNYQFFIDPRQSILDFRRGELDFTSDFLESLFIRFHSAANPNSPYSPDEALQNSTSTLVLADDDGEEDFYLNYESQRKSLRLKLQSPRNIESVRYSIEGFELTVDNADKSSSLFKPKPRLAFALPVGVSWNDDLARLGIQCHKDSNWLAGRPQTYLPEITGKLNSAMKLHG